MNAIDKIEEIKSVGGKVDINGYITLYHATSNTNASEVLKTGKMTAQEDGLFFSTKKDGQISGYGDTVLEFSIPIERLIMDDLFDNEIHFRLPLASKKTTTDVSDYLINKNDIKFSLQKDLTNTSEFKKWFGDSKVVDKDGKPLVVYHGTTQDFTIFKKGKNGYLGSGIYLTSDKDYANRYAKKYGSSGKILEAYANVKNPLPVTSNNPTKEILNSIYGSDRIYENRSAKQSFDTMIITNSDIKKLQSKGYDGIVWDYGGSKEISVFFIIAN